MRSPIPSPPRLHGTARILLGVALLTAPLVVPTLDVADPDHYRYEAERVRFTDLGVRYDAPLDGVDPDVACLDALVSRSCALERAIHANGGLVHDQGVPDGFLLSEYEYVYSHADRRFYEPVAEELANGSVRYDLAPAEESTALSAVATPLERTSRPVRRAVETGSVTTSDRLAGANELIETDDGYYVVHAASHTEHRNSERRWWATALTWLAVAVGLYWVLRGQRERVVG